MLSKKYPNTPQFKGYFFGNDSNIFGIVLYKTLNSICQIDYLLVDSQYRHNGYGSLLINKVLEPKYDMVFVITGKNTPKKNVYTKLGFKNLVSYTLDIRNDDKKLSMLKEELECRPECSFNRLLIK